MPTKTKPKPAIDLDPLDALLQDSPPEAAHAALDVEDLPGLTPGTRTVSIVAHMTRCEKLSTSWNQSLETAAPWRWLPIRWDAK